MPYGTPHLERSGTLTFFYFFSRKESKTDHFIPVPVEKYEKLTILDGDDSVLVKISYTVHFSIFESSQKVEMRS